MSIPHLSIQFGAVGPEVSRLQVQLNTRLRPSPKLEVDGKYGRQTAAAVRRFEAMGSRAVPGQSRLTNPPSTPPPPRLAALISRVGTTADFVQHASAVAPSAKTPADVLDALAINPTTAGGLRYLLVMGGDLGLIDFAAFFAAAGGQMVPARRPELSDVYDELPNCVGESTAARMRYHLCDEDEESERLGEEFGRLVRRHAESAQCVGRLLGEFLAPIKPITSNKVVMLKSPGRWDRSVEVLGAVLAGLRMPRG